MNYDQKIFGLTSLKAMHVLKKRKKEHRSFKNYIKLNLVHPLSSYLFHQPSLSLRGEEGVHEVIISLIRDLERLFFDVPVDGFKHFSRQIFSGVDASVLLDKLFS